MGNNEMSEAGMDNSHENVSKPIFIGNLQVTKYDFIVDNISQIPFSNLYT